MISGEWCVEGGDVVVVCLVVSLGTGSAGIRVAVME